MSDRNNEGRLLRDSIVREPGVGNSFNCLLVVSNSKVNRIVISKTAILSGLRAIESEPSLAGDALDRHRPEAVLIDCDGDHATCSSLFQRINSFQVGNGRPRVFVVARDGGKCSHHTPDNVDSIMSSPITTDRLGAALHSLFGD